MSKNEFNFKNGSRINWDGESKIPRSFSKFKPWGIDNVYPDDMTERAFPRLKLEETKINGLELNYGVIDEARNFLMEKLNKQVEDVFIEGLKRKGFEFENRLDLETFLKQYVRCEDNESLKERIYFVKNRPFLLYYYKVNVETPKVQDYSASVAVSGGHYAYL